MCEKLTNIKVDIFRVNRKTLVYLHIKNTAFVIARCVTTALECFLTCCIVKIHLNDLYLCKKGMTYHYPIHAATDMGIGICQMSLGKQRMRPALKGKDEMGSNSHSRHTSRAMCNQVLIFLCFFCSVKRKVKYKY